MASDSAEDEPRPVRLPTELGEWLDRRAAELGVDREAVLVQLVASYRAAADLDGDPSVGDDHGFEVAGPDAVGDVVEPSIQAAAAAAVEDALDEHAGAEPAAIEEFRSEFQAKIEDVRERVIQVKREADGKAPADHDHEELERIDGIARVGTLEDALADVESDFAGLEETVEEVAVGASEDVEALESDLAEVRERLQTVAWVVSDLREAYESKGSAAALEHIRREAAAADLQRARCERCGEGVEIGLLTEPACPHCDATVTDVEPASGFFGKPRLLVASQLEAGDGE